MSIETTAYDIVGITIISPTTGISNLKDLKFIVQDFNIYESVFSSTISGSIVVKDSNNHLTEMGLCGNEYIYIEFVKDENSVPYSRFFRIYKVDDAKLHNLNTLVYTIHFCTEEFILNQQTRISKSYKGFYNFQAVADILVNYLNVDPSRIELEQTVNPLKHYIVPNQRPFEAINMLATFSLNNTLTSGFLFFETKSGFKFLSLEQLYTRAPYKAYTLLPQNIRADNLNTTANRDSISNLEMPVLFDVASLLNTGGASSSMIKMNLVNQDYQYAASNPVSITPFTTLNEFLPFNDVKNRFGQTLVDGSSYVRYFNSYDDPLVDKWMLQRANQLALLNNQKLSILIAGDSALEAGSVVYVDFPYFQPLNRSDETIPDPYKAGNYLVTGVRHRIVDNKYVNYVELCKDSHIAALPSPKYNSSELMDIASNS